MTKTIKRVIAGVSALAIIGGAAVGGWAINEYVIKDDQFTITDQIDGDNGGMIIDEGEGSGIKLMTTKIAAEDFDEYGISPMAETAYTITVTPDPVDAMDTYTWTSSNSSAVSVSSTNGGKSCTATCLQPFGEQITLTCKSELDPDIYATVTVDYVKRVNSVSLSVSDAAAFVVNTEHTLSATPSYSVGTVSGTLTYLNLTYSLTEGFREAVENNVNSTLRRFIDIITTRKSNMYFDSSSMTGTERGFVAAFTELTGSGTTIQQSSAENSAENAFRTAVQSYSDTQAVITLDYSYAYGGEVYSSGTATVNIKFDYDSLLIKATQISLSDTSIVY